MSDESCEHARQRSMDLNNVSTTIFNITLPIFNNMVSLAYSTNTSSLAGLEPSISCRFYQHVVPTGLELSFQHVVPAGLATSRSEEHTSELQSHEKIV